MEQQPSGAGGGLVEQPSQRVLVTLSKLQNVVLLPQKVSFSPEPSRITRPNHQNIFLIEALNHPAFINPAVINPALLLYSDSDSM